MLRCPLTLGLVSAALAVIASCAEATEAPHVAVNTNLVLPKGVLDRVTMMTLTVLEGNVTCDPSIGQTTLPSGPAGASEIAKRELATTGCASGVKFCGDLIIEKSDAVRVFTASAKGPGDVTLAIGCAQAKVNQDILPVGIKMFRYLAPADCTDTVLQPTEQCAPGGTAVCDDACLSKEFLLSVGSTQTGTQTGGPGDKTDPFLLWPQASGLQGRFFAFYTDRAVSGSNNVEVSLRAMTDALSPIPAVQSPALSAGSIYLPNGPLPSPPAARQQSAPSAAFLKGRFYVAFQDDTGTSNGLDIRLRSMDTALVPDQGATTPLGINGGPAGTGGASGAGEAAIQSAPSIAAGPRDRLFVAWEDAAGSKISGRTLSPPSTLGNQIDLSTGTGNAGVSVATASTGWVVVWKSGTGIKLRAINEDGVPQGSEQAVNESATVTGRPRIASLPDGRFAVVWSSGGDIFVQRYDAKGAKVAGEEATAINAKSGDQLTPAIGATSGAGGSYVVAWVDSKTGEVNARMLGGSSGFLFNSVNGQSTEFQASRSNGRQRANPAVTSGGSDPFVAIGWEDQTAPGAGIVVRRFPLPSE